MATSGRKKAEKKAPVKVKRYEDGSYGTTKYKAATPTGASNRSAVAKKPAQIKPPWYIVSESAPPREMFGKTAMVKGRVGSIWANQAKKK